MPDIRCIAVVGTGAMGTGIAQIAAQAGLTVWLFDSRAEAAAEARQRLRQTFESLCGKGKLSAADAEAAQNRLRVAERLEQLGDCELVVEAIVERLEAKQELLRRLEAIVAPETILASNTSSLSITAIAAACERPQRVAGFHFFNPVPLMRVVEAKQPFGFRYNSDCRGRGAFRPRLADGSPGIPQVPVNLPTFDEVVGPGLPREAYNDFILERFAAGRDNVYTIHAEVEGLLLAPAFRELLRRAERRGIRFRPLGELLPDDPRSLPLAELVRGRLAGREGWLGVRQP